MKPLGPRAQQIRALREARAQRHATTKPKPAPAAPAKPKERPMAKKAKKAKKATAKRAAPKAKTEAGEIRAGSKLETVIGMLKRPEGCTSKEVCDATGWGAVSIPPIARRAGFELKKEKDGTQTRYRAAA